MLGFPINRGMRYRTQSIIMISCMSKVDSLFDATNLEKEIEEAT